MKRFRLFVIAAGLILLVCGLFFGAVVYVDQRSARELAQVKAQIRAAGLPLEARDLARPLPQDEGNAAPLYVKLNNFYTAHPLTGTDRILDDMLRVRMPTAPEREQLRQAVRHQKELFQRVHEAANRPSCNFNRNYSQGASLLLPEYSRMRAGVRALTAESTLLLADGKPIDAAQNQALGFKIAQHAATDPILIANLVGVALDAITLRGMEKILYATGEQPGIGRTVDRAIASDWKPHSLKYGMGGEFILATVEIERLRQAGPASLKNLGGVFEDGFKGQAQKFSLQSSANWQKFLNRNETVVLREIAQTAQVIDRPFWEAHPLLQAAEAQRDTRKNDSDFMLANILLPVYVQSEVKQAQNRAQASVVRSAACVLAYKQWHGAFPDTLNQAMTDVPIDPFDGKPLRYRREGAGFVVYSVGETGKFDGGTPTQKPSSSYESVFHYPMPTYLMRPQTMP